MALKADRLEFQTDISFFYNDSTAVTRGGVVVHDTAGSGAAMDQGVNLVKYKQVVATDTPVGLLLNDVVDKDLTRTHLNQYKDEVQRGGKVTILRKGWVVTNMITGTPAAGGLAFADDATAGNIAVDAWDAASSGNLCIGRFLSTLDEDSYCKVEVNLPMGKHATD
jgi:hypothetical protein